MYKVDNSIDTAPAKYIQKIAQRFTHKDTNYSSIRPQMLPLRKSKADRPDPQP